jgi:hypothetical protein
MAASASNAWVDLYLNALLGDGLSKEYVRGNDGDEPDQSEAANFFVNQILEAPEGIIRSWRRAQVRWVRLRRPERTCAGSQALCRTFPLTHCCTEIGARQRTLPRTINEIVRSCNLSTVVFPLVSRSSWARPGAVSRDDALGNWWLSVLESLPLAPKLRRDADAPAGRRIRPSNVPMAPSAAFARLV